jgi:hypothetical protein
LAPALHEADGQPIAGFGTADCEPLQADATQWIARWRDRCAVPTDRPMRVVFELTSTRLFSVATSDPGLSPPASRPGKGETR